MPEFKDSKDRTWTVTLTVLELKRVRELAGFDLYSTVEGESLIKLSQDPVLLFQVLFAVVKPQADKAGVTEEQFYEAMAGDTIAHATDALVGGLESFFASPDQRKLIRTVMKKWDKAMGLAYKQAVEKSDAIDVEKLVSEATISSNSSTEQPESAGSTPTSAPPES